MRDYTYQLFKDREDFRDVVPIPQDDHPRSIMKIAYSEQFIDAHDYLRALMSANEFSHRALLITTESIGLNPANFSTWAYRRNILDHIEYDYNKELDFVSNMIRENSKNYQVWYHRQWVLEKFSDDNIEQLLDSERDFIEDILDDDNKNYHAWQYLRWFIAKFPISKESQLEFTEKLIDQDLLNNSAWNHRFYVCFDKTIGPTDNNILEQEIDFVKPRIIRFPTNDSSWNYLYGLLNHEVNPTKGSFIKSPSKYLDKVRQFITDLENQPQISSKSTQFMSFSVDFYFDELCLILADFNFNEKSSLKDRAVFFKSKLIELCETLQTEVDQVRENYWLYRKKQIESLKFDQ